jgi:hypothetical protein
LASVDAELAFLPERSAGPLELSGAMGASQQHELALFAFDLLHRDGIDLRHRPLIVRRRRLGAMDRP